MLRQELELLLENGETLENVLGIPLGRNEAGERLDLTLSLAKPDPVDLYSPLYLSESPNYVAYQQRIRTEPYIITLPDLHQVHFSDLDAADESLRYLGKSLEDIEVMSDFWE